jgi:hypothetical protein
MARKKTTPEADPQTPLESGAVPSAVPDTGITERPPAETMQPEKAERLSFDLTPDGRIDFDRMRAGTKDKLRKAGVPIPGERGAEPVEKISTAQCRDLYRTYYSVQKTVAVMFLRIPPEVAGVCFDFSEDQFKERDELTRRVLDRYAGKLAYKDEIMLCMMLGNDMVRRIVMAKAMSVAYIEKQRQQGTLRPNGHEVASA